MKNDTTLLKLFIGSLIWTGAFFTVAAVAADKARSEDPELVQKLGSQLHIAGLGRNSLFGGHYQKTEDSWSVAVPSSKITLISVSADFDISTSETAKDIQITAKGTLDKEVAPRLLDVQGDAKELNIHQPDHDATRDLKVHVILPKGFQQVLYAKTVSGDVHIIQLKASELQIETISGDLNIRDSDLQKVSTKTVSGDVSLENNILAPVEAKSVSGDVKLHLKEGAKASYNLKSVSGDIHNHFGDGTDNKTNVSVKTTSGDISIE